uniref:Uncharacterized protein n=1 Tax=Rhizophora mucronata TaxID=61149 RepID=A0A2P2QEU0_RHIMU
MWIENCLNFITEGNEKKRKEKIKRGKKKKGPRILRFTDQ